MTPCDRRGHRTIDERSTARPLELRSGLAAGQAELSGTLDHCVGIGDVRNEERAFGPGTEERQVDPLLTRVGEKRERERGGVRHLEIDTRHAERRDVCATKHRSVLTVEGTVRLTRPDEVRAVRSVDARRRGTPIAAETQIESGLQPDRGDRVVDLDIEVVGGDGQTRNEGRLQHHTCGETVGHFLAQVRIAAEQRRNLHIGLDRQLIAQIGSRDTIGETQVTQLTGRCRRSTAGVGCRREPDRRTLEELGDVGRTDGALVLCTEDHVRDRRELDAARVGEGIADGLERILGIPGSAVEFETHGAEFERNVQFAERFLHIVAAFGCVTGVEADHVARGQRGVGEEFRSDLAVLGTHREPDGLGATDSEVAQRTGDRGIDHFQRGDIAVLGLDRNRIDLFRRQRVQAEDVDRRTGAIETGNKGGSRNVALLDVGVPRPCIEVVRVILQIVADRATHAAKNAECIALVERVTRTGLDGTATNLEIDDPIVRVGTGFGRIQLLQLREIGRRKELLNGRQIDTHVERDRGGSQLGRHTVVHESDFRVERVPAADVVIGIATQQVALLRNLEIVDGSVVVRVAGERTEVAGAVEHDEAVGIEFGTRRIAVTEIGQTTLRKDRRTALRQRGAEHGVAQREAREAAIALEHRGAVVIFGKDGGATAAIGERRADRTVDFVGLAVALFGQAVLAAHFDAFDIAEAEVDDACKRVGTVNGRSTAGHDVDRVDQERGDGVEIDDLGGIEEHPAATVDQHEVTVGAETAKVERRGAVAGVVREGGGAGNDLRQGIDDVLDVDRTRKLELFIADDGNGSGGFDIATRNARAGHDDRRTDDIGLSLERGLLVRGIVGVAGCGLRVQRRGEHGTSHDRAREQRSLREAIRHCYPLYNGKRPPPPIV